MKITADTLIGIIGLILPFAGYVLIGTYSPIIISVFFVVGFMAIIYSFNDIVDKRRDGYKHKIISYEYNLRDSKGEETEVKISHLLKVKKKTIPIGGCGFDSYPYNFEAWITFINKNALPSENKTKIEFSNPRKTGPLYLWDYYHKPPLRKGQEICIMEKFIVKNKFTQEIESDCYYALRKIEKFSWKIVFPIDRPCKKWWVTSDYVKYQPDNKVIFESQVLTNTIYFELHKLKIGHYSLHWEW